MENLDLQVLRAAQGWREAGRGVLLVTVIRTWGSSPRPVGSIMALRDDGAVIGSVSGGCIEDDLIHRYTSAFSARSEQSFALERPHFERYGVSADEAHRFGLPCGGTLELLIEHHPESMPLRNLVAALHRGELVRRVVDLETGRVQLHPAQSAEELTTTDRLMSRTFGPAYRMLLIGGGQLAEYVATMALFNGFTVAVCDPREEYVGSWSVPGATLVRDMPDDVVMAFKPDRRSCVIALTHDPKLDDLALMEALRTPAFYVGAIGSRRNSELRRQRLMEHFDLQADELARLRGPVGLYIGSKTPSEIAVSIVAEVLAVRNGVELPANMDVAAAKERQAVLPPTTGVACFSARSEALALSQ